MTEQKCIFITGAASGIGKETALLFARKGWFIGIVDLDENGLKILESEIGTPNCFVQAMDVTDTEDFKAAVDEFARQTEGKMHILFNNAGILRMGLNESISLEDKHRIVDINLKGVLTGIDCALPYLKQSSKARIISMCSSSSIYGLPELAVYSATKSAVRAITEALDIELQQYGIIVSDIIAPYVSTPMVTAAQEQAHSIESTGINLQPRQIAELVWKAAHGKKLHWKIHYLTHVLSAVFWLFPFLQRPIVKHLCLSPNKS